jgi:hypothetical protein
LYLDDAQVLMCEAQDVQQPAFMALMCTQVVMGLSAKYLGALGDGLLTQIESKLMPDSKEDTILEVFSFLDQRIRARSKQYLTAQPSLDQDNDKAAMFNAQPPPPQQVHSPPPTSKPPACKDRSIERCFHCGLMGHY